MSHLLLADARNVRLRAVHACSDAFMLRRVLFSDHDAEVRAAAARRLVNEAWLIEALGDDSAIVRDGVLRALAKVGSAACADAVRAVIREDRTWFVRRSAIYCLAAVGPDVAALSAALADPFWRVRHAAVHVLALLGARDPSVRDEVMSEDAPTLAYLRSSWGPIALDAPVRAASPSQLPAALLDPDPAVVAARLANTDADPLALVELLCDPHESLRSLAADLIATSGSSGAHIAALDWLEEQRIPHAADTVEEMLDRLGDAAVPVVDHALAHPERVGGLRWAIGWIAGTRYAERYDLAIARAEVNPSLRKLAMPIASSDVLQRWGGDDAARELHLRHAYDALLTLDGGPKTRALQLDARARLGNWDHVMSGLEDPHYGPRAIATRWLITTSRIDGLAQRQDPDPAVREAATTATSCATAVDSDPFVARAQANYLSDPDHADPVIRAAACRTAALARVLELSADRDELVRAAAADALAHLDVRLTDDLSPLARTMAHAWLHRGLDADAARAARETETEPRARALLDAIAGDAKPEQRPPFIHAEPPRVKVAQRRFGAPLAISGAFDLPAASYAHAYERGADTFFYEPAYTQLARFLRTHRDARVITGSYHADAASIEADVDRALRRLRRDHLDLFLLFWSRSPARVDNAAYEIMARLRGKVRAIGFSTHDRALARDAIAASPWDAVMIRHSAAHPGIETELLPHIGNTAIVTFSALCYGRMVSGPGAPSAADCYRYSLSQPGVAACISAPRDHDELVENLAALDAPPLSIDQQASLREFGRGVRAENHRFNALMRQPTRDAAAAARELLADEPAPEVLPQTRRRFK